MSITLEQTQLEKSRQPTEQIACIRCPNSLWFQTQRTLKCYCRQMFHIVWDSYSQPNVHVVNCDGLLVAAQVPEESRQVNPIP